jgi:aminoglycoside phosphotransferase (APT) family kinase protein
MTRSRTPNSAGAEDSAEKMAEDSADSTPQAAPDEVIDVRADERFDPQVVHDYLRDRLEGADGELEVRQFGGGHANLTYLLRFTDRNAAVHDYVLRRPPLGPVAKGAHDMKREYSALAHLWQYFEPAPRAFLFCDDPAIIGADFLVMQRRDGIVVRREVPPEFGGGGDPALNRKLSEVLIDTLADFHAVDPLGTALETLGRPEGFLTRQVTGWGDRFERSKTQDLPIAEEVRTWLLDNLPESPPPTLLHNDWKLDNIAVAADDPGRCTAVFDWDMCTTGDPLCDLGTLLTSWIDPGEMGVAASAVPTTVEGFLPRRDGIARYAERSGRDVSNIAYYHVFGTFKMAVVLQQIYFRFAQGQTQDARFEGMEAGAGVLFERSAKFRT